MVYKGFMIGTLAHILFNIIISVFIIYCCHSTWDYFKNTYTKPKTKDLVNSQINKYKQMMDEMQQNIDKNPQTISQPEIQTMDDDLTQFMEEQMKI